MKNKGKTLNEIIGEQIIVSIKKHFEDYHYDYRDGHFHTLDEASDTMSADEITVQQIKDDYAIGYVVILNETLIVPNLIITKDFIYLKRHSEVLPHFNLHLYTVNQTKKD